MLANCLGHQRLGLVILVCLSGRLAVADSIPSGLGYPWNHPGPYVLAPDIDFYPNDSLQSHKDCAMAIDPLTSNQHIVYVANSNHQWPQARLFKIMYKYHDGSSWQTVTIETLPQEIDDNEPLPYTNTYYYSFGVAIALEEDSTGTYTIGGIVYRYAMHYDHTEDALDWDTHDYGYLKYVPLTIVGGVVTVGTVDDTVLGTTLVDVFGTPSADWNPYAQALLHSNSIDLEFCNDPQGSLYPYIVFRVNGGASAGALGQVCYRYLDSSSGWLGTSWDSTLKRFTGTIYDETTTLGKVAGVSLAIDRSSTTWTPCVAFSRTYQPVLNEPYDVDICYDTPPYTGSPELVTTISEVDTDYSLGAQEESVEPCVRVSLAVDPTDNWKPCIAYQGDGICYTEKNSGVWSTPVLVREDASGSDDDITIKLGSLDIHPDTGRRWISSRQRSIGSVEQLQMAYKDSGVWTPDYAMMSDGSHWMPFLCIDEEYGMPQVTYPLSIYEKPGLKVKLVDSKTEDPITDAVVFITPVAGGTAIPNESQVSNVYLWGGIVPRSTNNSIAFDVRIDDPQSNPVGTVTLYWGETTEVEYGIGSGGCGVAAPRRDAPNGEHALLALLPLLAAASALGAWVVLHRRGSGTEWARPPATSERRCV